jgi:LacI family transcriptional regulator
MRQAHPRDRMGTVRQIHRMPLRMRLIDVARNVTTAHTRSVLRKNPHNPLRRIAFVACDSTPGILHCLSEVQAYAAERDWTVFTGPPTVTIAGECALNLHSMRDWPGDGLIVATNDQAELRIARRLPVPVVNLAGGNVGRHGIPRVMVNHLKIGRIAAGHLLERGLRRLGYYGVGDCWFSDQRERGFTQCAAERGVRVAVFRLSPLLNARVSWRERMKPLYGWLRSLPKPVGILAAQDYRARMVAGACETLGLRVPDDVAIVGVDNDTAICALSHPTLTSVSREFRSVGRAAAELLGKLMAGGAVPKEDILIEPGDIVARESTDTLAVTDALVREAVCAMESALSRPGSIKVLAATLKVSRRNLELRFREELNTSPQLYWRRLRIGRAQKLLGENPQLKFRELADSCGFTNCNVFRAAFTRLTGTTPAQFRRLAQDRRFER